MKKIIYIISLLCIFCFRFIPALPGMTASGMQVLGIFAGVLILWLTTAIDWPSVLCLVGLAFVPELKFSGIISGSVGNATFSFLLFTFLCTYAVSKTSFVKRCAVAFITNKIAMKGSWWFAGLYFLSVLVIGLFMSPVVLFVIYLPIHQTICEELELEKDDKLANMLMLGTLFCCAMACGMTPIAHVFSVMAIAAYENATGLAIGYGSYMAAAIPVGVFCFVIMMLVFRFVMNPDMSRLHDLDLSRLQDEIKPLSAREKSILAIFAAVIFMWVSPDLLKPFIPAYSAFLSGLGTTFPPMLGATAMFIIEMEGKPLLSFKEGMSKGVQWGSLFMAAATLAIGSAMTNEEIGLTSWLSGAIEPALKGLSPMIIILIFVLWAYIMTNVCSNMVTVTVVCAVAIPIALASNGLISAPAIASMIGMAASYAIVLPPAHPNVAVAIGTGWTTTSQIVRYGTLMIAAAVIATMVIGYPLASMVM